MVQATAGHTRTEGCRMIHSRCVSFTVLTMVLFACACGSSAGDVPATPPGADGASPGSDGAGDVVSDTARDGRSDDASRPDAGVVDSSSPQAEAGNPMVDAASDGASDGSRDSAGPPREGGGSACTVASDCRMFSNYCGGCTCDALGVAAPDPVCDAGTASCLVDPCQGHAAACDPTGHCTLH